MISKKTKEIETGLDAMSALELIRIFTELEKIEQGYEDCFGAVVGGHSFQCNTHRKESPFIIDGEPVEREQFFKLQQQAYLSLICQHGIQIIMRPPHKRKPNQKGPDGIIIMPDALLNENEEGDGKDGGLLS
jgi:hypothetical protein